MWNTLNKLVTTTNVTTTDITTTNVMDKEPDNGEEAFYEVVGEPIYNNVGKPAKENIVTPLTEWIGNLIIENPLLFFFVVLVLLAVVLFFIKLKRKKNPSTDPIGSITSKTESSSLSAYIRNHPLKQTSNYNNFLDYWFTGIGFYGRDTEMSSIHTFMSPKQGESEKVRFSILTITGKGGSGKSRIAFHTALLYSNKKYYSKHITHENSLMRFIMKITMKKWKVLWLCNDSITNVLDKFKDSKLPKKLLIICDYAGIYVNKLPQFIYHLINAKPRYSYIRIILLNTEHISLDRFKKETFDSIKLNYSDFNSSNYSSILSNLGESKVVALAKEKANEIASIHCIKKHIRNKKAYKEYGSISEFDVDEKQEIFSRENIQRSFILLLMYCDAALDYKLKHRKKFTATELSLDAEIVKNKIIIPIGNRWLNFIDNEDVKKSTLKLVALATVIGKFQFEKDDYSDFRDFYLNLIRNNYSNEPQSLRRLFSSISSTDTENLLNEVLPLTLGEFDGCYVVYHYSQLKNDEKKGWLNIFLNQDYSDAVQKFIQELCRNWNKMHEARYFLNDYLSHIVRLVDNENNSHLIQLGKSAIEYCKDLDSINVSDIENKLNNLENDTLTV